MDASGAAHPQTTGCCEDGEGEICCGYGCPCGAGVEDTSVMTSYVKVGEFDFTHVTGVKALYVALGYQHARDEWVCRPRIVIGDPDPDKWPASDA